MSDDVRRVRLISSGRTVDCQTKSIVKWLRTKWYDSYDGPPMASDELGHIAADEIDRLRARIEELEQILWVKYDANQKPIKGRYIITEKQIDEAWEHAQGYRNDPTIYLAVTGVLIDIGIVACSECSGSGYDDPDIRDDLGMCPDCKGHGWVWKENDDD